MKHSLTITDKDITGSEKLSSAPPRIAVNAVLFDADGNIAVSCMGKYDLHTLPGGGVEPGENLHEAIKREIWEETGCRCEIIEELGRIHENRFETDFTQERSYFTARVVGEKGGLHLTDEEIAENTTVIWMAPEQALNIISGTRHENYQRGFIQKRDTAALTWSLIWLYLHDIPGYNSFINIRPVNEGLSGDKKYYIETAEDKRLLLRMADISEYDRKKAEYERMILMSKHHIPMPLPVGFGVCGNGKKVYQLTSWRHGDNLAVTLPMLSDTEQYVLGLQAGKILRGIHSVPILDADITTGDWNERYSSFIDESIQSFYESGVHIAGSELIIDYFKRNRNLLKTRPQCYLHGDFHSGNMLLSADREITVVDWEILLYNNYGDPWLEITMQETPYFSTGMIRGYFGGEPPEDFWKILSFYSSIGAISAIPWAYYRFPDELDSKIKHCADILKWFENMNNAVPAWYLNKFYIQWIDGVPYRLKEPFDFTFLKKYGKVFKVFDEQDSGNICFGTAGGDKRYFVKFAGAPTVEYTGTIGGAIERLKAAVAPYQDLAHPALIRFVEAEEIGGGFAIVFDWVDAVCAHRMYPLDHQKFMQIPLESRIVIFEDILDFHRQTAEKGYTAVDFYDGSIMWDYKNRRTVICDIDFYTKGKAYGCQAWWGHMIRTASPEERTDGVLIDEISNVYNMGAIAFLLLTNSDHSPEAWPLNIALYHVVRKAVNENRRERQQSIEQLIKEWEAAR